MRIEYGDVIDDSGVDIFEDSVFEAMILEALPIRDVVAQSDAADFEDVFERSKWIVFLPHFDTILLCSGETNFEDVVVGKFVRKVAYMRTKLERALIFWMTEKMRNIIFE
jgi:hypothetical protein